MGSNNPVTAINFFEAKSYACGRCGNVVTIESESSTTCTQKMVDVVTEFSICSIECCGEDMMKIPQFLSEPIGKIIRDTIFTVLPFYDQYDQEDFHDHMLPVVCIGLKPEYPDAYFICDLFTTLRDYCNDKIPFNIVLECAMAVSGFVVKIIQSRESPIAGMCFNDMINHILLKYSKENVDSVLKED